MSREKVYWGTLQHAIDVAVEAHHDQVDRGGAPYILHPLRVMFTFTDEVDRIVAVLHDVVEDSPAWDIRQLRIAGFSELVVDAVRSVSRFEGGQESYDDFIARCAKNEIGRRVKIADLRDNMDLSRLPVVQSSDIIRNRKYEKALATLLREPSP